MSRSRIVFVYTLCLVLFTTVFIAAPAYALGPRAVRLLLGGGWMGQSYDWKGTDLFDSERKFWMTGGVSLEVSVFGDSPLDLEIGAMYVQKGMQMEADAYDEFGTYVGKVTVDPNARYLSLPVLLRYRFGEGSISPYIVAGPTLEIMLSKDAGEDFEEVFDKMDTANMGIQVGVGVEMGNIGASLRYIRDLNGTLDKPADWTLESVTNDGVLALVTLKLWGR